MLEGFNTILDPKEQDGRLGRLLLGNAGFATEKELLDQQKVTHIYCCLGAEWAMYPSFYSYKAVEMDDVPEYPILPHFSEAVSWIDQALQTEGQTVLVHCHAGVSRSASIVAAYLIYKMSMSAEEAVAYVTARRDVVAPNPGFLKQLKAYEQELLLKKKEEKEVKEGHESAASTADSTLDATS